MDHLIPSTLAIRLQENFEPDGARLKIPEMQMEESAGLGFGVSALFLVSVMAVVFARQKKSAAGDSLWLVCVRWAPVVSLLAVMTQSNLSGIARILTPYYLLLLPPLLACGGHEALVKKSWWRASAFAVFLLAAGLLVISPPRPLFPVQTILKNIHLPDGRLFTRIKEVYSVYGQRNDGFAPARKILPPGLNVLGMVTFDDPETSLWRPFGSRRIEHVCPQDTPADLKQRGIEYILVSNNAFNIYFNGSFDEWCRRMNAQVVQTIPLTLRASAGPRDWHLIKL